MSRVLVFGAGGYLGIPLCNELVARGHYVVATDRYFFGQKPNASVILRADIRAVPNLAEAYDAIFDLAGLSNDASAEIDPSLTEQINEVGGCRLADQAKAGGVRRYIYSSSASVYGHGEKIGLTETDPINPLTAYARSKVVVENHLRTLASDGFEPVILRNATAFGLAPRMRFDLALNVMTLRAWRDGVIYVLGQGEQWRPMLHVDDIVQAFCLALEAPAEKVAGQTFNVGANYLNVTIRQLANVVKAEFPNAEIHTIPEDADQRSYNLDFKKIYDVLGFVPKRTLTYGIREIRDALMSNAVKDDLETRTVQFYKAMLEWNERIEALKLNGRLL